MQTKRQTTADVPLRKPVATMLAEILPCKVVAAEVCGRLDSCALFPVEQDAIVGAVEQRQLEFAAGRSCARSALLGLGARPVAIPREANRAPGWPDGVVGSITHCAGYCAAAVARREEFGGIGIDAESAAALPAGVLAEISLPAERVQLDRLCASFPQISWDRLLFSAKEAVYKAWAPITGKWLDFTDVRITLDSAAGQFEVAPVGAEPSSSGEPGLEELTGRWLVRDKLILTAVVIPA